MKSKKQKTKKPRTKKPVIDGWTPVENGDRYCSPSCGRGCTKAEFELAEARANALARQLGPGWTPVLKENLGWHYHVVSPNRRVVVVEHLRPVPKDASLVERAAVLEPECYGVFVSRCLVGRSRHYGNWYGSGRTLEEALAEVTRELRSQKRDLEKGLNAILTVNEVK